MITLCIIIYRCVPFPHSHLFCGQYINASTMVYIDPNVFNYTEANNRIAKLDSEESLFTNARASDNDSSCQWKVLYTVCLFMYPHCSIISQALVPPCMDDCIEYTTIRCRRGILGFSIATGFMDDPLNNIKIDCSAPFSVFSSVSTDTENCHEFNCT